MPRAGEAPQRTNAATTFADWSGRCRPRMPASRSTLTSNALSEAFCRAAAAIDPSLPIEPRSLFALHRSHGDAGDSLAAADPAHALVGGRLDADPGRGRIGEDALHLAAVRPQPRLLADDGRVDVDDLAADRADGGAQQVDRVGAAPALLVVGEEGADVAAAGGAQQRVDHRVGEHVGVGVAAEAARVLDLHTAQDQRPALGEAVTVVADADAHLSDSRLPGRAVTPNCAAGARRRRSPPRRARRGTRAPAHSRSR